VNLKYCLLQASHCKNKKASIRWQDSAPPTVKKVSRTSKIVKIQVVLNDIFQSVDPVKYNKSTQKWSVKNLLEKLKFHSQWQGSQGQGWHSLGHTTCCPCHGPGQSTRRYHWACGFSITCATVSSCILLALTAVEVEASYCWWSGAQPDGRCVCLC